MDRTMNMKKKSRRQFLKRTSLGIAGVSIGSSLSAQQKETENSARVLRIAHLTDIHIEDNGKAPEGMARALEYVNAMDDKPDVIFNGGDSIMDALKRSREEVRAQWKLWHQVLEENNSIDIKHCIGNHDVWGWSFEDGAYQNEPLYGKQWAVDEFGLSNRYYSFDMANWHFIVLDSTHRKETPGYTARLDDGQFEWLTSELERTDCDTPICILSHIPILAACAYFDGDNEESGDWVVPGAWMHTDARKIKTLLHQHPNVKLALSGHIHLQDTVEYLGVKYYCNGAVSGGWWNGKYQEFPPALAIIDLYGDGSSARTIINYTES